VVVFASARRAAEVRLRRHRASLQQTLAGEREARREAERANRVKDDFLAMVSHELRTPLNVILGWAAMISRHDVGGAITRQAAAAIERSAAAQAQLIEDILDASRIATGGLRLNPRVVALAPIVRDAVETMRLAADTKGLTLDTSLDERVEVNGDPNRLRQIAWNLISNAIKFTPPGGRIDVRLEASDAHAQLQVHDTGIGIPAAFLPHVFEQFRQADATMTREQGGLGLGLAIVRHLVELHGGTVSAESDGEGRGSTFAVRLPLAVTAG
jgi:two-component system CheB/CheR fusion protein